MPPALAALACALLSEAPPHPARSATPRRPRSLDLHALSDLRARPRDILIVTTAAIPWMTGTSINPLLRALHLALDGHRVTLCVPFIDTADQALLFSTTFSSPAAQASAIRAWAATEVSAPFDIVFYNGVYSSALGSIMPLGQITDALRHIVHDVCILEEPEHLTWHRNGAWKALFSLVIGVIHTNYLSYVASSPLPPRYAKALSLLNSWVCRCYCHRVIRLSAALQPFPNSLTSNIHGVRRKFLAIGAAAPLSFTLPIYFLGKALWSKGYRDLFDLLKSHHTRTQSSPHIDLYGAGPDAAAITAALSHPSLANTSYTPHATDHATLTLYKIYLNASVSDVVCTATAEALSMGKTVVLRDHPSNDFFRTFANAIFFRDEIDFSDALSLASSREPRPLSDDERRRLTWEAATQRFYDAVRVPLVVRTSQAVDGVLVETHKALSLLVTQPAVQIRRGKKGEGDRTGILGVGRMLES